MKQRKTLREMASDQAQPAMQVGGKPASTCPYCGAGLFVDGVNRTDRDIVRYVICRNQHCGKRFMTHQVPAKIVREIKPNSADGNLDDRSSVRIA